jgi:hypothetical protein
MLSPQPNQASPGLPPQNWQSRALTELEKRNHITKPNYRNLSPQKRANNSKKPPVVA